MQFIYSRISSRTKTAEPQRELRARYPVWEDLRDAPVEEIERAIHGVTFPEVKAPRLKPALLGITARDAAALPYAAGRRGDDGGEADEVILAEWDAAMLAEHHSLVKLHAQTLCTFVEPRCAVCPLLGMCPKGK